jgi:type II secretory pathway pseudopilin PulG
MVMLRFPTRRAAQAQGFTYLVVLLTIAVMGIGLLAIAEVWVTTARREQLRHMDWVGEQYTHAIRSYYLASPGSVKHFPGSIQDLLEDSRHINLVRHLRSTDQHSFSNQGGFSVQLAFPEADGFTGVKVTLVQADEVLTTHKRVSP